ncbi:MAG: extracellular solute-binding protein [Pontibacterium sp.]
MSLSAPLQANETVNIYSYRQAQLIQPLLTRFEEKTGIQTQVTTANAGLIERIEREGRNTPADILLTADIAPLVDAKRMGILSEVNSRMVRRNVAKEYRDEDNYWVGLTRRARFIFAAKGSEAARQVSRYEDLADPAWKGQICMRSGKNSYNLSLFASMIAQNGEQATEAWLTAVKDNLARRPQGNDTSQFLAVANGECTLTIGNSYYFAQMSDFRSPEAHQYAAQNVAVIAPNQSDRGTHVNISGAAITKHAKNPEGAKKLIEYLLSEEAQNLYAEINLEFPVRKDIVATRALRDMFPSFEPDNTPLSEIGALRGQASRLVDKVRFDQ